jgi:hypothetical protein
MPCALQLNLNLQLPASRPLIPLEAAMVMLDRDEDDILASIEMGGLTWAWDIRSADAERREIRIWRDCIVAHLNGDRQPDAEAADPLSLIVPAGETIRSVELRTFFTASHSHVLNLIAQGLVEGRNRAHRGPNGFVRVSRGSVLNFLRNRRII